MFDPKSRLRPARFELFLLLGILTLAAVLRLAAPGVVEFKRDEANLSHLALDLARGRDFPLLGISSSVGLPNPPVSVYLFAIPYGFTSDPTFATQFVGVLNVLAVLLTYLLARRYYGARVALAAALIYAVSPWGIIYSRKIWAQDLLPPFVVATLLLGLLSFVEGKRWTQWLFLPLLAVTVQIHYSALVLILPAGYLIWTGRTQHTRAFMLSLIPTVLVFLPFIIGILQADFPSLSELQALASSSSPGEALSIDLTSSTLQYAALTIAGTEIHSLAGPEAYQQYLASVPDVYALFGLLTWGVLLAGMALLIRVMRKKDIRAQVDGLLLLWLLSPILAFSVSWTTPYPHYLIVMMPATYIVLAIGIGDLWAVLRTRPALRRAVFATGGFLLATILVFQVVLWLTLVSFLRQNYTPDGFGTPLASLLTVQRAILSEQPTQVIARLDGQFVGTNDDATVWNTLLYDVPEVRFRDDLTQVYPADSALLLSSECLSDGDFQQFLLRTADEGCYQISSWTPIEVVPVNFQVFTDAQSFTNGVNLIGYSWSDNSHLCLDLVWTITSLSDQDYMFSVHFFNAQGEEIVNADGLSWRGIYWRPGDTVVRQFCLFGEQVARSAEIVGVNVGMYTYDGANFHNVDVLDGNGSPVGQTVSISFTS